MTNSIEEILGAELLFVIGSNATEAHPIIGNKMKQAVKKGTYRCRSKKNWLGRRSGYLVEIKSGYGCILIKCYDESYHRRRIRSQRLY